MKTLILGHRGSMVDKPENTAISFEKALDDGADGIEFDVHLTKDGIPVVMHDEKVDRTTDSSGLISEMTLSDLKEIEILTVDKKNTGERILTLDETLDICAKRSSLINIELKQGPVFYPGLEEKVIKTIMKYGIIDKVIISSFNHYSIKAIQDMVPALKCGLLYMAGLYQPWEYAKRLGVEAIHPYIAGINEEVIRGCQENNVMVNVFGANDKATISKFLRAGVDGIITDNPALAVRLRDGEEK